MADQVGTKSSEMKAAEQNFRQRVEEFDTATQNIRQAVENLAAHWFGGGFTEFQNAMLKWEHDMKTVGDDLTGIADAVHHTDDAFQSLDSDITRAFSGFN